MAYNFLPCDREQLYLMPPSVKDWLPQGDLAWFLLDAVGEMDLGAFYERYRADGNGRPAYDPRMMVGLLLYTYCMGERSSRRIERLCERDVAFRVLAANRVPDHATIARFRRGHEKALSGLFADVLRLCAEAGLVKVGVVALDGTKMKANAALSANRSYESLKPGEAAKGNVTDPESRILKTRQGYVQGYNAQAVTTREQVIVAAEVTVEGSDGGAGLRADQVGPGVRPVYASRTRCGPERVEAALHHPQPPEALEEQEGAPELNGEEARPGRRIRLEDSSRGIRPTNSSGCLIGSCHQVAFGRLRNRLNTRHTSAIGRAPSEGQPVAAMWARAIFTDRVVFDEPHKTRITTDGASAGVWYPNGEADWHTRGI